MQYWIRLLDSYDLWKKGSILNNLLNELKVKYSILFSSSITKVTDIKFDIRTNLVCHFKTGLEQNRREFRMTFGRKPQTEILMGIQ